MEAKLFAVRDALQFEKSLPLGLPGKSFQGDSYYVAENLGPVAIFTYYIKEGVKTKQDERREKEKEAQKESKDNAYPSYEELKLEMEEDKPQLVFTVQDASGRVIRQWTKAYSKGVSRETWDLRYVTKAPIDFSMPSYYNAFADKEEGTLVQPGIYSVTLSKEADGIVSKLAGPVSFEVKRLNNTTMPARDLAAKANFQRDIAELNRKVSSANGKLGEFSTQLHYIKEAVKRIEKPMDELLPEIIALDKKLAEVRQIMYGDPIARTLDIDTPPSIVSRIGSLDYEQANSTGAPTKTHRDVYNIAKEELAPILDEISKLEGRFSKLQEKLEEMGAPYTPGRKVMRN
jgi:hypothetical protein